MATCFSFIIIKVLGLVSSPNLTFHQVKTKVLPVAVVFSMSIMLVNQGQLRLTVSFLQVPQCAEYLHPPTPSALPQPRRKHLTYRPPPPPATCSC